MKRLAGRLVSAFGGATPLAVYGAVGVAHLAAVLTGSSVAGRLTQALLMPALAGVAFRDDRLRRAPLGRWVAIALAFGWLGDVIPGFLDGTVSFATLVACFLVAQVAWTIGSRPFVHDSVLAQGRRAATAPYVLAAVVLLALCAPRAGVLAPAVVVYGVTLLVAALHETGLGALGVAGGATFIASDGMIALFAFVGDPGEQLHDLLVMSTYIVASGLLVAAARERAREEPRVVGGA